MAAKYRKIDPRIWNDENGIGVAVSLCKTWMPHKNRLQAKARRFVSFRDKFQCCKCGRCGKTVPPLYDGLASITPLEIDHKFPQSLGGGHHPDNLQLLCQSCNARKCGKEEV